MSVNCHGGQSGWNKYDWSQLNSAQQFSTSLKTCCYSCWTGALHSLPLAAYTCKMQHSWSYFSQLSMWTKLDIHFALWLDSCSVHTTALSHTTDILSSIPLVPSGIRVKSSFPIAFCAVEKLAWALEVTWRSPLEKAHKTLIYLQSIRLIKMQREAI